MKTTKRILSIMMAVALMITMITIPTVQVKADGNDTIIIDVSKQADASSHVYEAYQIFSGDVTKSGDDFVISNVDWGDGVNDTTLLAALKAATFGDPASAVFESCTTADEVANLMKNIKETDDMVKFAKIVNEHLVSAEKHTGSYDSTTKAYTISGLDYGYYLVVDKSNAAGDARSRFIVDTTKDGSDPTVIEAKSVVPTIDKDIIEDGVATKANTATIGDTIEYKLSSEVPDMTGYNKYYFVVEDTLSKGLTFDCKQNGTTITDDSKDVVIKIGDTTQVYGTDYTITHAKDGDNTKIRIVFKDFINQTAGDAITISYSATLNELAEVSNVDGNPNTVKLTYSNDPTHTYDPESPDDPEDPENPDKDYVTDSPEVEVITYTTQLELTKTDGTDTLTGAMFKIENVDGGEPLVLVNGVIFREDADGTYYMLKNGLYTEKAPGADGAPAEADYASTTTKYSKVTDLDASTPEVSNKIVKTGITPEAYVKDDGKILFTGLGQGTYKVTEVVEPEGYNKIDPFYIQITGTATGSGCTWTAKMYKETVDDDDAYTATYDGTNFLLPFTVVNSKGLILPSTGGIGTTIFYIAGGLLVLVAGVLLITKKRMEIEK